MKTITILFGEMGCGKTYCGSHYAERHDFKFFDGDSVVTPQMLDKVLRFQPIPRDVLKEYIGVLTNSIVDQMKDCDNLVVAQALYLNEDRESIKASLESAGFTVRWWWVQVPLWRNVQNLLTRKNKWKWVYYWALNKLFFQKPTHSYETFLNVYQ
jgi:gluconate kinase